MADDRFHSLTTQAAGCCHLSAIYEQSLFIFFFCCFLSLTPKVNMRMEVESIEKGSMRMGVGGRGAWGWEWRYEKGEYENGEREHGDGNEWGDAVTSG